MKEISPLRYASQQVIHFIICILTLLVMFLIMQKFVCVCVLSVCAKLHLSIFSL